MAKIVDPDALSQELLDNAAPSGTTEVSFDTTNRLIWLNATGNLDNKDGVTLQALYSFCKEEWKEDPNLIKLPFPFEAITEVKFDLFNGWDFGDDSTKNRVRDGGWSKLDGTTPVEQYFGFITLGTMVDDLADRAYYQQEEDGAPSSAVFTGPANEPVKIYGDATHGSVDFRSIFRSFLREQGKTYASSSLAEQAVLAIDYTVYKLPLANAVDPKIENPDGDIETLAPWTGMSIEYLNGQLFEDWVSAGTYVIDDVVRDGGRWYRSLTNHSGVATAPGADATNWESFSGERQIGANWYAFNVFVNANNALAERVYEFTQHANRQSADINSHATEGGVVIGQTAPQLLSFLGDTLITGDGVYLNGFNANDTNRIEFNDATGTTRTFPFVSAGEINFNNNLQNDTDAVYWMFFAADYGTTNALIVEDNDGVPITGNISGQPSVSFTFDYDGNNQGGRTPGTDANVVIVAIGLQTAQFVSVNATIGRAVGQQFSLVSNLERNYSNPN